MPLIYLKIRFRFDIEKANSEIRGLYVAILKHFLETLESDVLYINREEDMGLEELRKAKTNMHPIYKVKKFTAHQSSLQLQQANDTWLPQIKQLWIEQFKEESEKAVNTISKICTRKKIAGSYIPMMNFYVCFKFVK